MKLPLVITFLLVSELSIALSKEECTLVTMTGNPNYAPVTWSPAAGTLVGSYIAFTQAVLDELGVESVAVEQGNWRRAQEEVKRGKIDMLIGPWFNKERQQWLLYVQPEISLDPAAIFMNTDNQFDFSSMEDLKGRIGVVQRGNSFGEEFDDYADKELNIDAVSSREQTLSLVVLGRADYAIGGYYSGMLLVNSMGYSRKIIAADKYLTEDKMYIAFSRKSPCRVFAKDMSEIIIRMKRDRILEGLTKDYIKKYNEQ